MGYMHRLVPILLALELCTLVGPVEKPQLQDRRTTPTRHFLEFFAGDRSVTKGMRLLGYVGDPVDIRFDSRMDILTPFGFLTAIAMVWTIARGGLCWFAPPCSSWVWMSHHTTGRHISPQGNEDYQNVRRQNILVSRLCYLIALCRRRGVHFIIEQPASSVMLQFSRLKKLLASMGDDIASAVSQLGSFNLEMQKDVVLTGWAPHIANLGRRMSTWERGLMRDGGHKKQSAHHWTENGKKRSRGADDLKPSQAYPTGFGCHHALAFADVNPPTYPGRSKSSGVLLDDDSFSDSSVEDEDPALADLRTNDASLFVGRKQTLEELRVPLKDS